MNAEGVGEVVEDMCGNERSKCGVEGRKKVVEDE